MFFIIPYSTDAPIYHWPIATVLLIVVNCVVFALELTYPEQAQQYILVFGQGIHPAQWITSNFMHLGFMHLAGNMVALWTFGLVIEGKLGCFKMLAISLHGAVGSAIVQSMMAASPEGGGGLGASGVIYGLMAMSLIWAPENKIQCYVVVFYFIIRTIDFEISIMAMVGLMLLIQITVQFFIGMHISSGAMHIIGALVGFSVAIAMLKARWVNCENWDAFSVWAGRNTPEGEQARVQEEYEAARQKKEQTQQALRQSALAEIHAIIQSGQALLALKAHQRMVRELPDWTLSADDLFNLILALHKNKLASESVPVMAEYIKKYPQNSNLVRLKLAQILATVENRPAQALHVLAKIDPAAFDARQQDFLQKLRTKAEQLHQQDPYEIVDKEW